MAEIDYRAEVERSRVAQGLDPQIPQHLRDAVAAMLPPNDSDETNNTK
jgi:hypothetical protein